MKNFYPTQVNDVRFKVDRSIPKKIQLLQEFGAAPGNGRLFVISLKHKQKRK